MDSTNLRTRRALSRTYKNHWTRQKFYCRRHDPSGPRSRGRSERSRPTFRRRNGSRSLEKGRSDSGSRSFVSVSMYISFCARSEPRRAEPGVCDPRESWRGGAVHSSDLTSGSLGVGSSPRGETHKSISDSRGDGTALSNETSRLPSPTLAAQGPGCDGDRVCRGSVGHP